MLILVVNTRENVQDDRYCAPGEQTFGASKQQVRSESVRLEDLMYVIKPPPYYLPLYSLFASIPVTGVDSHIFSGAFENWMCCSEFIYFHFTVVLELA